MLAHSVRSSHRVNRLWHGHVGWRFAYPTYGQCKGDRPACRPDKALAAIRRYDSVVSGGASLTRPTTSARVTGQTVGRIRRSRHPALWCGHVGWRFAYPTYDQCKGDRPACRPDKALAAIRRYDSVVSGGTSLTRPTGYINKGDDV